MSVILSNFGIMRLQSKARRAHSRPEQGARMSRELVLRVAPKLCFATRILCLCRILLSFGESRFVRVVHRSPCSASRANQRKYGVALLALVLVHQQSGYSRASVFCPVYRAQFICCPTPRPSEKNLPERVYALYLLHRHACWVRQTAQTLDSVHAFIACGERSERS